MNVTSPTSNILPWNCSLTVKRSLALPTYDIGTKAKAKECSTIARSSFQLQARKRIASLQYVQLGNKPSKLVTIGQCYFKADSTQSTCKGSLNHSASICSNFYIVVLP
jgi:hypothetical protein